METDRAREIEEASYQLDGETPLGPAVQERHNKLYVQRPSTDTRWLREAITANRNNRTFHWFYTGHTGAGKSTELNIMMADPKLRRYYLPVYFNIEQELDVHNLEHTDVLLAMARACVRAAELEQCPIPEELKAYMDNWGKEVLSEAEVKTLTEGTGGLKLDLFFLTLGEQIKSGGEKRKLIRERLYNDTAAFIRQLDTLADALKNRTGREPLCILDGLDHVDTEPCRKLFVNYYNALTKPKLSKLFVIPLSLINTDFAALIEDKHSTLANIKVFESAHDSRINNEGFGFFKDVVSRYIDLTYFEAGTLEKLFLLSGGVVRDMIKHTGNACGYAADDTSETVTLAHVQRVWDQQQQFYRRILYESDYEILRKVAENPYPRGMDGLSRLLFQKAILFYPNGEGWYGVHPAVHEIIEKPDVHS